MTILQTTPAPKPARKKRPGRRCLTEGCPGEVKEIKRKNYAQHIKRRFSCLLCRLRWTSIERNMPQSIDADGPHGAKSAAIRLANWLAGDGQSPPVTPNGQKTFDFAK